MPFVFEADWNMSLDEVASTTLADSLQAAIVADTDALGTCTTHAGTSCVDVFLVSRDLAEAASRVAIVANAPIATHRPVMLEVRADAAGLQRAAIKQVQSIPAEAVFGPRLPRQDWQQARALANAALKAAQHSTSAGVQLREQRFKRGSGFTTVL